MKQATGMEDATLPDHPDDAPPLPDALAAAADDLTLPASTRALLKRAREALLAARSEARAKSVAEGAWPPKGGPDWLDPDMTSAVALPLPFSPLQ